MKRSFLFSALLSFAGTGAALAQAPSHSFSLEAVATSAGGSTQQSQGTQTRSKASNTRSGSGFNHTLNTTQTTTTTSQQALQISVRNLGHLPDAAHVEWYFIAAPVKQEPGKSLVEQQYAFDQGAKDVNLGSNGAETFPVESIEITSSAKRANRTRMSRTGSISKGRAKGDEQSGNKLSGWVVRVVADNRVVAVKGSSQSLEEIARDEAKLRDLVSE